MAAPGLIGLVDRALSPERRKAPVEELRRARLLAGILVVMVVNLMANMLVAALVSTTRLVFVVCGVAVVCYLVAIVVLRFGRGSLTAPALLLCTPLVGVMGFFSMCQGSSYLSRNPFQIAAILLAGYLIGQRVAYFLGGVVILEVLLVARLHELGLALPYVLTSSAVKPMVTAVFDGFGIAVICALSHLYESSRAQGQRALQLSEANLKALTENTDASICYLDTNGKVVAANSTLRQQVASLAGGRKLEEGEELFVNSPPETRRRWKLRFQRALAGERLVGEERYDRSGQRTWFDYSLAPIPDGRGGVAGIALFGHDITRRKEDEAKLLQMHRQLVDASRQAGMAEVATGILHNIGNILNSVNVSAHLITSRLTESKVKSLALVAELMLDHQSDLPGFLGNDRRGQQLPQYLERLAEALVDERAALHGEAEELVRRLDHVLSMIAAQETLAKGSGVIEMLSPSELLDDALRLHEDSFARAAIRVERRYDELPAEALDRHKLLQIVVNLIANARDSLVQSERPDKRLAVSIGCDDGRLRIEVQDNGVGLSDEARKRMFQQGFTTKKGGHGFGLHMSALLATEMGGSLGCVSDGPGCGAHFTLELPLQPAAARLAG